jgi:hypothetical protein
MNYDSSNDYDYEGGKGRTEATTWDFFFKRFDIYYYGSFLYIIFDIFSSNANYYLSVKGLDDMVLKGVFLMSFA